MVDQRLKELRGPGRREFLRWSAAVAACLGLERARFLNVVGDTAGTAAADTAACRSTNLHIHVVDGNGGLSNWTQAFPFTKVIGSTNPAYAHYALGKGIPSAGFDKPFIHAPDSPWQSNSKWKLSAFVAGRNEAHTPQPVLGGMRLGASGTLACAAAIQQANPSLLPVLVLNAPGAAPAATSVSFGAAAGAPAIASVGTAAGLVDLFNSAASRALLQAPANGPMAESYYKAFLGLNAAAGRTSVARQYDVGKVSISLLSKNLAARLAPTGVDQALFGLTQTTPPRVREMANAMITGVKAFSLGLTSMLVIPGFYDDPHGMFIGGLANAAATSQSIGKMLNGLHDLAKAHQDPSCTAKTLADSLVFSVNGDTYKEPFQVALPDQNGNLQWGDGTPTGSNVLYVMGAGQVKTGWHGDMDPTAGAVAWDPATGTAGGDYTAARAAELGAAAGAALLFAIAKGDMRRVRDFYTGPPIDGIVNLNVTG